MNKKALGIIGLVAGLAAGFLTVELVWHNHKKPSGIDSGQDYAADMSGYASYDENTEYNFVSSNVAEVLSKMNHGDTFTAYFGFSDCPWCVCEMPLLNEAAADNGQEVLYVDTRANPEWKSNSDIDGFQDLVNSSIGQLLEIDEDGSRRLYVPLVLFVKDGTITAYHQGTLEGHNAHENPVLTEEQSAKLLEILNAGFAAEKTEGDQVQVLEDLETVVETGRENS